MKFSVVVSILFLLALSSFAQHTQSENLIIITLDGFRWQEVFRGADPKLSATSRFVKDKSITKKFLHPNINERRKKLMPFFWNVIDKEGQLYGNRDYNNLMNCSNIYRISYAGYSEMLVGFPDNRLRSNRKVENKNSTVLEFIHKQPGFDSSVAAFSTWGAIPLIIRSKTANIHANGGREKVSADKLSDNESLLNELQDHINNPYGERFDAFTFYYAFEYLKREAPRTLFISFDETDEHGHGGRYDEYLKSAHHTDQMIGELWHWLQSQEQYKDKTTLIITTDHGRGKGSNGSWKRHGRFTPGSYQTWFAVIGPDTPAMGEIKLPGKHYQKQIAKTAAAFLGLKYENIHSVGDVIKTALPSMQSVSMRDDSESH
jgi:hypothetical protein